LEPRLRFFSLLARVSIDTNAVPFNAKQTMGTTIRHSLELKMGRWHNPISTGKDGQQREGVILSKLLDQACLIVLMHVGHAHHVD
jgi:hypothetical protein